MFFKPGASLLSDTLPPLDSEYEPQNSGRRFCRRFGDEGAAPLFAHDQTFLLQERMGFIHRAQADVITLLRFRHRGQARPRREFSTVDLLP